MRSFDTSKLGLPRVWCELDCIWPWSESLIATLYDCFPSFDLIPIGKWPKELTLTMSPFLMTPWIRGHGRFENVGRSVSVNTLSEPFLSVLNPQGVGSLSKLNIQPKYSCAINNLNQSSDWCSEFTGQSSCDLNHQETCSSNEVEYCHRNDIITCSFHCRWFKI